MVRRPVGVSRAPPNPRVMQQAHMHPHGMTGGGRMDQQWAAHPAGHYSANHNPGAAMFSNPAGHQQQGFMSLPQQQYRSHRSYPGDQYPPPRSPDAN